MVGSKNSANIQKGDPKDIENYRPIAYLCSSSKVFEKLILRRILETQENNNEDLTGENHHGFERKRNTSKLSVELQSIIGSTCLWQALT
jgi:hypothetical protein